jgi:hypothetical protein
MQEVRQFYITGTNVAAKLSTLPREQRIFAEKLINDVLFEAEPCNLTRNFLLLHSIQQVEVITHTSALFPTETDGNVAYLRTPNTTATYFSNFQ